MVCSWSEETVLVSEAWKLMFKKQCKSVLFSINSSRVHLHELFQRTSINNKKKKCLQLVLVRPNCRTNNTEQGRMWIFINACNKTLRLVIVCSLWVASNVNLSSIFVFYLNNTRLFCNYMKVRSEVLCLS